MSTTNRVKLPYELTGIYGGLGHGKSIFTQEYDQAWVKERFPTITKLSLPPVMSEDKITGLTMDYIVIDEMADIMNQTIYSKPAKSVPEPQHPDAGTW